MFDYSSPTKDSLLFLSQRIPSLFQSDNRFLIIPLSKGFFIIILPRPRLPRLLLPRLLWPRPLLRRPLLLRHLLPIDQNALKPFWCVRSAALGPSCCVRSFMFVRSRELRPFWCVMSLKLRSVLFCLFHCLVCVYAFQRFSSCLSCPSVPMFCRESLGIVFPSVPSCPTFFTILVP